MQGAVKHKQTMPVETMDYVVKLNKGHELDRYNQIKKTGKTP